MFFNDYSYWSTLLAPLLSIPPPLPSPPLPPLPPCPPLPLLIQGKSYDEIAAIRKAHINPLMQLVYKKPLLVSQVSQQLGVHYCCAVRSVFTYPHESHFICCEGVFPALVWGRRGGCMCGCWYRLTREAPPPVD